MFFHFLAGKEVARCHYSSSTASYNEQRTRKLETAQQDNGTAGHSASELVRGAELRSRNGASVCKCPVDMFSLQSLRPFSRLGCAVQSWNPVFGKNCTSARCALETTAVFFVENIPAFLALEVAKDAQASLVRVFGSLERGFCVRSGFLARMDRAALHECDLLGREAHYTLRTPVERLTAHFDSRKCHTHGGSMFYNIITNSRASALSLDRPLS